MSEAEASTDHSSNQKATQSQAAHSTGAPCQQQSQSQQTHFSGPNGTTAGPAASSAATASAQVAGVRIKHYRIRTVPYQVAGSGAGGGQSGPSRVNSGGDGGNFTDSSGGSGNSTLMVGFCITSKRTFPSLEQLVLHYKGMQRVSFCVVSLVPAVPSLALLLIITGAALQLQLFDPSDPSVELIVF